MTELLPDLPVDDRRKLPIPYMNRRFDGTWDFLSIYAPAVIKCLNEKLCGICGEPLKFASAFVGGPLSFQSRVYSDPPFHPECAKASMRLCPHMLISHAKRATERRAGNVITHESATLDKPQEWVIGIAPTSETTFELARDGIYIYPGRFTKRIAYPYGEDGKLTYPLRG